MTSSALDYQESARGTSPMLGGQRSVSDSKPQGSKNNALDSQESLACLRQMEEWYEVERIRQAPNRYQMAIDHDFYDNLQWSDEDAQELALRGQAPLVYNKVQPAVKWLTGTEKRTRIDYKILPRNAAGVDEALNKTKLMKYLGDVNKTAYARSRCFEDTVKVGVGWLEGGIRGDPTMELIYARNESWRNIIYDSQSVEFDMSDARYLFRDKWTDEDIACALFPKRAMQIKAASVYSDYADAQDNEEWYLGQVLQERSADGSVLNRRTFVDTSSSLFNRRARVKLHECWYRRPTTINFIDGRDTDYHNQEFDPKNSIHASLYQSQVISLYGRLGMKMWCAIFLRGCLLQHMQSPYNHNDFPFTPVWGNRRGRDNAPYGVIRVIRDPQEDFNKRMSKALYALSTRRVIMDKGAIEDIDEVREEAARPDSVFVVTQGMKFELHTDMDIAEEHIKYANLDEKAIQDNSGVTDELMGHKSNAISGVAIEKRQDQGSTVTTDFFDNLRLGTQLHGQKELSLLKQYMVEEKQIRITGAKPGEDFVILNQRMPDGSIMNDVTLTEADFIVDETDYKATQRQAMFEVLMETISKLPPEIAIKLLDDAMEFSDVPGKEQIVATIRQINGKPDPSKRLSPEEQQAQQAQEQKQAQEQEAMKQLQMAEAKAQVDKTNAEATELIARAGKMKAEADAAGNGEDPAHSAEIVKLHEDTDRVISQLRDQLLQREKQIMEANGRLTLFKADERTKLKIAGGDNNALIEKTKLEIASREKIAAAADATAEATAKQQREIEGLKQQIADLSKGVSEVAASKLDKPVTAALDPFQKLHERIDKTDESIKKVASKPAEKPAPAEPDKTGPAVEKLGTGLSARMDKLEAMVGKVHDTVSKPPEKPKGKKFRIKKNADGTIDGETIE